MEKNIFTRSQHTLVYTAAAAVVVFMIAVIGGIPVGGAIIFGLLIGCILLLMRRQDIFVETGEDVLDGALNEAMDNMRVHAKSFQKVSGMQPAARVKAQEEVAAAAANAVRPAALNAPREGKADDLDRIEGIGPKIVTELHAKGPCSPDWQARRAHPP